MYKLIYKRQFVAGFDADQVVGNLAQLLQIKPKTIRLMFLSERPSVLKILHSTDEVQRWRAAFLEAGVHLDVVTMAIADADDIADQIELELELHSIDDEGDEVESPRQLMVRKIIAAEETNEADTSDLSAASTQVDVTQDKPLEQKAPEAAPVSSSAVAAPAAESVKTEKSESVKAEKKKEKKHKKQTGAAAANESVAANEAHVETIRQGDAINQGGAQAKSDSVASTARAEPIVKLVSPVKSASVVTLVTATKAATAKSEPAPKVEPAIKLVPATEPKPDVKTKPDVKPEPENKSEPAVKVESEVRKVEPVVNPESEAKPESPSAAGQESESRKDAVIDTVPAVTTDPEVAADTEELEQLDDEAPEVDWHGSSFVLGMLVILLAIATTAGIILWLKQPLWTPVKASAQSDKVINAIATESLFALAHADVSRLQQLPDVLRTGADLNRFPAPDKDFWINLERAGINIAQQLDQAWVAAYRAENTAQPLWVLTGNFNAEKMRAWLRDNYTIDEDTPQQIVFSVIDDSTCEKQPAMMAVIESDRVLLGAPERVAAFRGRFDAAAPAAKNLSDWKTQSGGQMLSVALFNPAQFAETTSLVALGRLAIDPTPIQGIYLGVAPRLLPPVLEFTAVMVGANQQFIDGVESKIAPALREAKNTIGQDWPETVSIYERMKLDKNANQLQASVFFDERLQAQLQLWASSLFVSTFAMNNPAPAVAEEQIDAQPRIFQSLPSAELPDFATSKHLNSALAAQTSAGPFGVGISSIEATDKGVLLSLDVNAFNLPNLGKEAKAIQFRITDIVDHQNLSLLPSNKCDAADVRQATSVNTVYDGAFHDQGQSIPYTGIQGTKQVLLPENINLSTVGAIKGEINYVLPVNIERVKVDLPLAGKVINSHGLQLRFLSADANRVYFQHSGNSDALLQVTALNAEGNVLAATNRAHGMNVPAVGGTTSIDVQGTIAAVEVVVASKLEYQTYPFSFGRIQPPEQTFAVEKTPPDMLTAASLAGLEQDTPPTDVRYPYQTPQQTIVAGPALIAVNQLSTQAQKLSLAADIYLRDKHPLTRQLSAVRFLITEVEDSAGDIHSVVYQAPVAVEYQGGTWVDGVYQSDPTQPWLRGQLDLREQDLGVNDVVAFWGKLVFLAAAEPIAIQLPFQFGMQWNGAASSFKLARWEAGRLLFDIHGSFPELMAITALDDNGQPVSQAAELRTVDGVNQVELPINQRPATIEFSIAREQKTVEFPFEIRAQL